MVEPFEYVFPAIRGIQAKREFYVSQCPLLLIPKIFLFDEEELSPELRAQRVLNRARVPEMAEYMTENRDSWVFSALTASVDADVRFDPFDHDPQARIGLLHVPMSARFIINDGQHRRAAIEIAIQEDPDLADESIGVVFFIDRGLARSQQMFADLNRHAVKPSKSLGLLYDQRDPLAEITRLAVFRSEFLRDVVELEKSTLAPRSRKLFTLSALHNGTVALLGDKRSKEDEIDVDELARFVGEFWTELIPYFPEWRMVRDRRLSAAEVRRDFIHSHALVIHALGIAGHDLISAYPDSWKERLQPLGDLDWSRSNSRLWEGRALTGGKVTKSRQNLLLTTNAIKKQIGLELSPQEHKSEAAFEKEHA